jgi:biopolymer transport protein ExbD
MRAISRTALTSDINVTPLVDVCLVLLIIFMVVTPLMVTNVPVNLPVVGTGEALARQPLQITLQGDGTLFIGDQVLRMEQATSALERERGTADRPIVVQADKTLPYGRVVELLDICRRAGFSNVGLAARSRDVGR